jgi:hypothetical protein
VPQHYNSTFDNIVSPVHFSATQDPFNVSSVGAQGHILPQNNNSGGFDGMTVFNENPIYNLDSHFDFGGPSGQNRSTDFAASGSVNLYQWPLGGQFQGQLSPVSDFTGNLSLPSLLGSDIPIPCNQFGCLVTFKRDPDRARHGINQTLHLRPVFGCNKSQGRGYTRKDKLTEHMWKKHMWKKHGNLGYVKRT